MRKLFGLKSPLPPALCGLFAQGLEPSSAFLVSSGSKSRPWGSATSFGGVAWPLVIGRTRPFGGVEDKFSLAEPDDKKPKFAKVAAKRSSEPQMGQALRSVYQRTVEEAVPDEMLELLSKLD